MGRNKKKNPCSESKDECMEKKKHKKNKIVVYHISEDLIIEILLRLPPPSVVRFKQVCKTWYSLITNPGFLRTHSSSLQFYNHTTTTDDEELMVSSYASRIIPLHEHPLLKQGVYPNELLECCLISSCNGLLLFCKKSSGTSSSYYVCNPMIKHYVKIPNITITGKLKVWDSTSSYILFDPSTSLSYKLIRCLKGIDENNYRCDFFVYSSDIGSWRFLRSFPSSEIGTWRHLNTPVFLNGTFYWKATYNSDRLVCFDLKEENVWFLPLPPKPMGISSRVWFYFGECDGRLRLIEKYLVHGRYTTQLTFPCSFDIMETEPRPQQQHDGNLTWYTWSVKYHVNIKTGYDHLIENPLASTFRIIQVYKTKKNEEALLLNIHGKIVSFNVENNTFGKGLTIQNQNIFTPNTDFSYVCPYITTTLLPLI